MHERLLVSIKVETRSTSRLRSALFTLPLFYLPMVKIYVRSQIPGDTVFTFPNGEETAIYVASEPRKGLAFVTLRPRVLVRPRESNPQHLALQSSALPTELILPRSLDHMISLKEYAKKNYKCSSSKTTRKKC